LRKEQYLLSFAELYYRIVQALVPRLDSIRARLFRVEHCHILQVNLGEQSAGTSLIISVVLVTMRMLVAAALVMRVAMVAHASDCVD
jgi:hypothetical protein